MPLVVFPGLLIFLEPFFVSKSSPTVKEQPCVFLVVLSSSSGISLLPDAVHIWEGAARTGRKVSHLSIPLGGTARLHEPLQSLRVIGRRG